MDGRANTLSIPVQASYEDTAKAPAGFDEAFTLHHRAVFRTARSYLRDNALAEDVTQEVFLRLYKNLESVPGEDLLRAWLIRVTINLSLNTLRGHNRTAHREEEYVKQNTWESDGCPAPDEEFERRQQIEQARSTLGKIKEPMRSCLVLKQQGLSYREIASALNINESSVGIYVARGRKEFVRLHGKVGTGN